jgi:hypothetical protein
MRSACNDDSSPRQRPTGRKKRKRRRASMATLAALAPLFLYLISSSDFAILLKVGLYEFKEA